MSSSKTIPLFWWSEIKFLFKQKENYGDLLSKYLVEKISGKSVVWVQPKKQSWFKIKKQHLVAIGSILPHVTKNSIVWGSGIIDKDRFIENADFRAVRGPKTRETLLEFGYDCPEVYGDPALLLPLYYNPEVKKRYLFGVIPHYNDFKLAFDLYKDNQDVLVIDLMTMDIEEVTRQILSCNLTISSSLHGIIVSHAYKIPSIWVEFSNKIFGDGIKYEDYLESVGIPFYAPIFIDESFSILDMNKFFNNDYSLPKAEAIEGLQSGLLKNFPYFK